MSIEIMPPHGINVGGCGKRPMAELNELFHGMFTAERLARTDRAIWLHTLRHMSGSKIAMRTKTLLKVPTTSRKWRTVPKLRDMARALE